MAKRKMYRAGDYIESFDDLEEIFKVSDYVMMQFGFEPKWKTTHKAFIISMPYHSVRKMLRTKGISVAIKN